MRGEVLEWGSIVFLGAKTSIFKSALLVETSTSMNVHAIGAVEVETGGILRE